MTPHPHAQNMLAYSQDAAETDKPWERWECDAGQGWQSLKFPEHPRWTIENQYRRKRRMILVNGVKVPAPETTNLIWGTRYYLPTASAITMCRSNPWEGDFNDKIFLERGLVYLNESDAIDRTKAMLITTPCEQ